MGDPGEENEANGRDANCSPDISSDGLKNVNSEDGLVTKVVDSDGDIIRDIEEYVLKDAVPKNLGNIGKSFFNNNNKYN